MTLPLSAASGLATVSLTLALVLASSTVEGKCYGWRCEGKAASEPTRRYIVNEHRQKVGDVYDLGAGRRLHVRDKHRQKVGTLPTIGGDQAGG